MFLAHFPHPDKLQKGEGRDPYGVIRAFFGGGNAVELFNDASEKDYKKALDSVSGLARLVKEVEAPAAEKYLFMELALHGLAEFNVINKDLMDTKFTFDDSLAGMLGDDMFDSDNFN